jgi:hypothetical protein
MKNRLPAPLSLEVNSLSLAQRALPPARARQGAMQSGYRADGGLGPGRAARLVTHFLASPYMKSSMRR